MPTEDDLRQLLAAADAPNRIDAKQVIRRSRARRLPKQIAAGAGGALVLASVTVLGVQSIDLTPGQDSAAPMMSQESEASDASTGAADESAFAAKRLPADRINLCGFPLMDTSPSQFGLVLDVAFPATAPADAASIDGTVIMTNTSDEPVTGTIFVAPSITLSQDGMTLWHTNNPEFAETAVDLAPGAALQFPVSFEPVRCEPQDDELESFRPGLPPVGPGDYELSAALDFSPAVPTATTELDLVTGPRSPITLD